MISTLAHLSIFSFFCIIYLIIYFFIKEESIFSPKLFFFFSFGLFYLSDSLFMLIDSINNRHFYLSGKSFAYKSNTILLILTFYTFVLISWVYPGIVLKKLSNRKKQELTYFKSISDSNPYIIIFSAIFLAIVSVSTITFKIIENGGLLDYFSNLSKRSLVFLDFGFQNGLINMSMVVFVPLVAKLIHKKRIPKWLGIISLLIFSLNSILTGARVHIVFILFSYFYMKDRYFERIEISVKRILYLIVTTFILVSLVFSTRSTSKNHNNFLNNLFNTGQIPQSNNLHILTNSGLVGDLGGESIRNDVLSVIPRKIFNSFGVEKKMGGNTNFTEKFWNKRWTFTKSQISLGGINELVYNFGFIITLLIMCILSILYNLFFYKIRNIVGSDILDLISINFIWSIFLQIRGDYFHTINKMFIALVGIFIYYIIFFLLKKNKL